MKIQNLITKMYIQKNIYVLRYVIHDDAKRTQNQVGFKLNHDIFNKTHHICPCVLNKFYSLKKYEESTLKNGISKITLG